MTSKKQMETKLKELGYYSNIDINGECDSDESTLYKMIGKKKNDNNDEIIANLSFSGSCLEYCCGVVELGNLNFSISYHNQRMHKDAIRLFIQLVFLAARDYDKPTSSSKIKMVKSIIFVSNGVSGWEIVEEAILKIPEHFLLASVTKNPGSRRILKLFVGKP